MQDIIVRRYNADKIKMTIVDDEGEVITYIENHQFYGLANQVSELSTEMRRRENPHRPHESDWQGHRICKDYLAKKGMNTLKVEWMHKHNTELKPVPVHVKVAYLPNQHQLVRLAYYSTEDMDRGCPSLECAVPLNNDEVECEKNDISWGPVEYPGEPEDKFLEDVNIAFNASYSYDMFNHMGGLIYPERVED